MTIANTHSSADRSRWIAVILTGFVTLSAITIQWGVVTAKLDNVEKRLDEFIADARATRANYTELERRVAFLEGRSSKLEASQ